MRLSFVLAVVPCLALCAPAGRPRISEILYDPAGSDTGYEFVELFNPGPAAISLAGLRLEAGDGAAPGRWTARWSAGVLDSVPALGRFVIGGALVTPAPDAIVTLGLQNGPDAVRLVWPDGATEVVGYGALAYPEYFCGAPAIDVPGGQSLARLPDDADAGTNALDFAAAEPSPGRANQVRRDAAIERGSLRAEPAQPAAGRPLRISAVVLDRGSEALAAAAGRTEATVDGTLLAAAELPAIAPGDSARIELELPGLAEGIHTVALVAVLSADERPDDDADTLRVRAGSGPLEITEIQFHPAAGEGEWVEVRARAAGDVPLDDFVLADRVSAGSRLPAGSPPLERDSLAVLAQDRAALLARFPGLDGRRVIEVSPWPALNNSDDSSGFADAVVLRGRDGLPCDRVDYSARGIRAGVPIELGATGWGEDSDPAGTPLAPPRVAPAIAGTFALAPRRAAVGASPTVAWSLPWARAWLSAEIFDLSGRLVSRWGEADVGSRGVRALPRFTAPGVYFVALRARPVQGPGQRTETRTVRIEQRP
jgi:hypothetical protein